MDYYKMLSCGTKLFQLPLDVVMKNNIALSYFMDYMTSIGAQNYLFFYLNIEGTQLNTSFLLSGASRGLIYFFFCRFTGWKVSAEQQLADLALNLHGDRDVLLAEQYGAARQTLDRIKEAACSIFEQYLSEKVT